MAYLYTSTPGFGVYLAIFERNLYAHSSEALVISANHLPEDLTSQNPNALVDNAEVNKKQGK